MKILLLEDDPDISFIYKRQLEDSSHQVDAFLTGKDALQASSASAYDIILIDIMLPDTNGLEVLKQLKQFPHLKSTTMIVLSNMAEESVVSEAKKLGSDGYIIKSSLNPDQLIEQIVKIHKQKQSLPQQTQ